MSLATMTSSAADGIPRRPRRAETAPSFITPPAERAGSSQCEIIVLPNVLAYSSACLIISALATGLPSSENPVQPASAISPISASSVPIEPLVIAPMGNTLQNPAFFACPMMNSVTERLSFTGLVFGIQQMVVNPPAAAARAPDAMSSLYSKPGSRRWQCMSISPGATIRPLASITSELLVFFVLGG